MPDREKVIDEMKSISERKAYEIEIDCMWDREYEKWVPTIFQCGCCHAKVDKTDTICWHCRSKLNPILRECQKNWHIDSELKTEEEQAE